MTVEVPWTKKGDTGIEMQSIYALKIGYLPCYLMCMLVRVCERITRRVAHFHLLLYKT